MYVYAAVDVGEVCKGHREEICKLDSAEQVCLFSWALIITSEAVNTIIKHIINNKIAMQTTTPNINIYESETFHLVISYR